MSEPTKGIDYALVLRTINGNAEPAEALRAFVEQERENAAHQEAVVLDEVRAVLADAIVLDQKGPDQFKTGQEHLPPAFREVNWQDAFTAVAGYLTRIEHAVQRSGS